MAAKKEKEKSTVSKESFVKRNQWQLLLAALVFLVYANSIFNGYNLDDELVTRNHRFTAKGMEAIPDILTNPYYADAMGYKYEYRPVVHVTFAIEHQFFGESAKVSHFFNLALYAILCIVLYNLLKRLFQERYPWLPIIASIIFAVHPIHTEVVCSIKNRDEILSLLFMLLAWKYALNFYYHDAKAGVFSVLFVLLSLLSKNTSFPLLIFIPLSTLLSKVKVKFTYFQVYAFAALAAIFAGVLALRDFIVPIAALLILPTYFVLALTNMEALKNQLKELFQSARQNSIIRENTGIIYPFIPTSIMARLAYLLAAVYIVSSTLLLHPYILLLNAALLLAALLFFRVGFLRLVPLLAAIVTGYLLFHDMPDNYIMTALLYVVILAYTAVAFIKKDHIAAAIMIFPFIGLQIIHIDGASILMLASLVIYFRTQKVVWLYAMAGIAAVVNLSTLTASFINFKPEAYLNIVRYGGQLAGIGLLGFILLKQKEGILKSIAALSVVLLLIIYGFFTFQIGKKIPVSKIKFDQPALTANPDYTAKTFEQKSTERNLEFPELPIGLNPTPSIRFGTAATIFTQYLKLTTIAYPLSYYYGFAVVKPTPLHATAALAGIGLFALLSIAVLFFFRRNLLISIGIAFFLITVFPFLDIIIPLPGMMADRFLLIPSIGFCIAIAGALHYFIKEGQHPLSGIRSLVALPITPKAVLLGIALIYSGISIARNEQWENHLVLFKHDIKHLDESTQAHNLLALQYTIYSFDQKDPAIQLEYRQNAEKHFKRAIEIYPQFFNPHFDLARLNELMNRPDSALKYYQKTITIDSTFPTPYLNASRISQAKNDLRASVGWLQHGLRFDTLDMEWYNLLSYDLYRLNDYKGSAEINKLAMRRIGVTADLLAHVGQAYLSATELDSARVYLEKANAMNPNVQGLQGALQQLNTLQKQTPAK